MTPYLTATGNTAAVNNTTLVARVLGFIQEIDYKDGDGVKAGTQLFVIEPEPYQLALEQAQSSVSSADAAAKQSEANYNRTAELVKKGFATQQDLDAAAAQQAADAARQKQSAVDVKQAQLNLSYTAGQGAVRRHRHGAPGLDRASWSAAAPRRSPPSSSSIRSTSTSTSARRTCCAFAPTWKSAASPHRT